MTITAEAGPQIVYGITQTSTGQVTEYNEERGPSVNDLGQAIMDPRSPYCYQPGSAVGTKTRGFWNGYAAIDQIPGTVSTNCIALTQVPSSGTFAVTLVTCSSINSVITNNVVVAPPEGGTNVTMAIGLDMGTATSSNVGLQTISFGSGGSISMWDPRAAVARTIQWTGSSNSSNEVLSVAGRDLYGFKMTESIPTTAGATTNGVATIKGQKAWKYISAVTLVSCSGTLGSTNLIVGVNDTFGFPMRVDQSPYATIWYGQSSNNTLITISTGNHTFAFTTAAQVSTSQDVRGTYSSTGASNSSAAAPIRLTMFVTPSVQNLPTSATGTATGMFGLSQFSSI